MDLTAGAPFWPIADGLLTSYPRLSENLETEVCIIGGGVSGAMLAYAFAQAGVDVAVIEKREVGYGSTAANTGLLTYELDAPLVELADRFGERTAVHVYSLLARAVGGVGAMISSLGDDCGFKNCASLYLARSNDDVELLTREAEARRRAGLNVEFLSGRALRERFGLARPAALWSPAPQAAQVDPFRLTHRLLEAAVKRGARVFDRTEAVDIRFERDAVTLSTKRGHRVRAQRIAFATGYQTPTQIRPNLIRVRSTFALASEPVQPPPWLEECLLWERADAYLYARTTADGRVIVGGEDCPYTDAQRQERLVQGKARALLARFDDLDPHHPIEIDWAWGGAFVESCDGLPYIGQLPEQPLAHFALGYGGNGTLFSHLAAELLVQLHLEGSSADSELFRLDRDCRASAG